MTTSKSPQQTLPDVPTQRLGLRRSARYALELVGHCARELDHDRADQMAAALTYRTIFSLVPMVALALMVFNSLGGFEKLSGSLEDTIYDYFGLSSLGYTETGEAASKPAIESAPQTMASDEAPAPPPAGKETQDQAKMRANIKKLLIEAQSRVASVSFASIGIVGLLLFIWAALSLAVSLETAFNAIYNAPRGRPWHLRVTIYWAAITLGPVLLFVSLFLAGKLASLVEGLGGAPAASDSSTRPAVLAFLGLILTQLLALASHFTALLASWLLLFLLYRLLPNTKVRTRPALIGSFVAAVLWETGKWLFKLYVQKAVPYSAIYGSLGLVPLFLFWVYVTWLVVLFGLELSHTLQAMRSGNFKYVSHSAGRELFYDPRWLIPMLGLIGKRFSEGKATSADRLAAELALPARVVTALAESLEKTGLVRRTQAEDDEDAGYTLARPPERIKLAEVVDLSRTLASDAMADQPSRADRQTIPGWPLLDKLTDAQRAAAGEATLATILTPSST